MSRLSRYEKNKGLNFDYEVTTGDGTVVDVLNVDASFSARVAATNWSPAEGGELEDLAVYLNGKDVTGHLDVLFGEGTYEDIAKVAKEKFKWL